MQNDADRTHTTLLTRLFNLNLQIGDYENCKKIRLTIKELSEKILQDKTK